MDLQSVNGEEVNHTLHISFQFQQLQDSTDKIFTEPHAIRKQINKSCISSYRLASPHSYKYNTHLTHTHRLYIYTSGNLNWQY